MVCVWGNHTSMLDEQTVGRAVTFQRVTIQEHEGALQLGTPKDSSMSLGNTPRTLEILEWLHASGGEFKTVQEALAIAQPAVHGN
jgi:hypothetical protein